MDRSRRVAFVVGGAVAVAVVVTLLVWSRRRRRPLDVAAAATDAPEKPSEAVATAAALAASKQDALATALNRSDDPAAVRAALSAGAVVDGRSIALACTLGRSAALAALLAHAGDRAIAVAAESDEAGWCAAHIAARMGYVACLVALDEALTAAGADDASRTAVLDAARPSDGATPLMLACSENQLAALQFLLRLSRRSPPPSTPLVRVDVALAGSGITPLMMAARGDFVAIAQALLAAPGVRIDAAAADGRTALSVAAQHDSLDCLRLLLERGAAADGAADAPADVSPLAQAAVRGHVDAMECLLTNRAHANVELESGAPLLLALCEGREIGASSKRVGSEKRRRVRYEAIAALLHGGADPWRLSNEAGAVGVGDGAGGGRRRESVAVRRCAATYARESGDVQLAALFSGGGSASATATPTAGSGVHGGEP